VVPGVFTASFFCNTDRANAQIASFYPGAMAYATRLSFHNLPTLFPDLASQRIDLAVISPNDPKAMEQYMAECIELGIPYLYDPSQQIVYDRADLKHGIEGIRPSSTITSQPAEKMTAMTAQIF
jgi:adenosine kinase